MKIKEINLINLGVAELLQHKLDTRLAYKLVKLQRQLNEELKPVQEVFDKIREEHKNDENLDAIIDEENRKLGEEEVEIQIAPIHIDDLPPEIDGYIIQALERIIEVD